MHIDALNEENMQTRVDFIIFDILVLSIDS